MTNESAFEPDYPPPLVRNTTFAERWWYAEATSSESPSHTLSRGRVFCFLGGLSLPYRGWFFAECELLGPYQKTF
jgi:hypothetical protein